MVLVIKNPPAMQERCKLDARVGEDYLEKEMATQSSVLDWYSIVHNLRILPVFVRMNKLQLYPSKCTEIQRENLTFYLTLNFIM